MTPAQLQGFKKALLELRRDLAKKGLMKLEPNRSSDTEPSDEQDEQPLNEMMQILASARNRNTEGILGKVEKALRKIEEEPDDFGVCEDCNEDIIAGRLKAMPYAELCVACQSKLDAPKGPSRRNKLTDYS